MSDLYLDEIEKIKFYKERIAEKLLSYGIVANKERIQKELDEIDLKLAIFSQAYIQSGSQFSVDTFNAQKQDIYQDLVILYKLVYHLAEDRIEKTRTRIRYELDDLRNRVKEFQYLVDAQTVSVYGKTVFHQACDFVQEYQDGQVIIDLGPVTVSSGAYLAPMLSSDEINIEDVTFVFTEADSAEIRSAAYNYGKNYVKILGNYQLSMQTYTCQDKVFGKELIPAGEGLSEENRYNLFLNQNQILVRDLDGYGSGYKNKMPELYYTADGREEISFYVYGASKIQFAVMGELEYKNFVGDEIISPKQRQKIILRGNHFSFDIKTDGIVYADKISAKVQNDQLSIDQNFENITDYTVENVQYGDDVTFDDVKVIIDNAQHTFYDIKYIVIKQARISELEDIL